MAREKLTSLLLNGFGKFYPVNSFGFSITKLFLR